VFAEKPLLVHRKIGFVKATASRTRQVTLSE
jgi:hypothetical protein